MQKYSSILTYTSSPDYTAADSRPHLIVESNPHPLRSINQKLAVRKYYHPASSVSRLRNNRNFTKASSLLRLLVFVARSHLPPAPFPLIKMEKRFWPPPRPLLSSIVIELNLLWENEELLMGGGGGVLGRRAVYKYNRVFFFFFFIDCR